MEVIDVVLMTLFLTFTDFTHCSVVSIFDFEQVNMMAVITLIRTQIKGNGENGPRVKDQNVYVKFSSACFFLKKRADGKSILLFETHVVLTLLMELS